MLVWRLLIYQCICELEEQAGSARGDQGGRTGAGAPPVAAPGIIGQVASHLPIKADKKGLGKAEEIVKSKRGNPEVIGKGGDSFQ